MVTIKAISCLENALQLQERERERELRIISYVSNSPAMILLTWVYILVKLLF